MSRKKEKKRLGRPPNAENKRASILRVAARLFATHGYDNCSMEYIASELALTKAALYHYFPNKEAIYTHLYVSGNEMLYDYVTTRVDFSSSYENQLRQLMVAHANALEDHYWEYAAAVVGFGGLVYRKLGAIEEAQQLRDRYEKMVRGIIEGGIANGEFQHATVTIVARAILSLSNWMARWYRPGGSKTAMEIANEYADLLLFGLVKSE